MTDQRKGETEGDGLTYEGSPKHKHPWQRGRRGSLCPRHLSPVDAGKLLGGSIVYESKRYAAREGQAFCAQEHRQGLWHGYPVGWREVPPAIRRQWISEGVIRRRDLGRNW